VRRGRHLGHLAEDVGATLARLLQRRARFHAHDLPAHDAIMIGLVSRSITCL